MLGFRVVASRQSRLRTLVFREKLGAFAVEGVGIEQCAMNPAASLALDYGL